ncbi:hypothetical protein GJV08_02175 [Enterobacteriaceae bacterium RIT692]|nr:hypothetical protein [Enterobacteriaceae bacterium RIT692]
MTGMKVFQDLIVFPAVGDFNIRNEIISKENEDWVHDGGKETDLANGFAPDEDVIVFHRRAYRNIDDSILILWKYNDRYSVTNIVPQNVGELGVDKYNSIINDFVERIISPLSESGVLTFELTKSEKDIRDILSDKTASLIEVFSRLANKSTGASHPLDKERWIKFLIESHVHDEKCTATDLMQWFVEIEKWPEEKASELAISYEFSRDLLNSYDKR